MGVCVLRHHPLPKKKTMQPTYGILPTAVQASNATCAFSLSKLPCLRMILSISNTYFSHTSYNHAPGSLRSTIALNLVRKSRGDVIVSGER